MSQHRVQSLRCTYTGRCMILGYDKYWLWLAVWSAPFLACMSVGWDNLDELSYCHPLFRLCVSLLTHPCVDGFLRLDHLE